MLLWELHPNTGPAAQKLRGIIKMFSEHLEAKLG
jgi:hypothetical protein